MKIAMRRLKGLMVKETLQIFRDPSSLLIAFILPAMFLVLYGNGLSLDLKDIKFGIAVEDSAPKAQNLVRSFENSKYYDIRTAKSSEIFKKEVTEGNIRGFLVIPQDFSKKFKSMDETAEVQIVTDGSDTNTANLVENYTKGVWQNWLIQEYYTSGKSPISVPISIEPRVWFNPELKSANSIIPGIIAIVMALVGTLLTSLVVAREWERGTMEAIMATPVRISEIITGKVIPYFILGMISMLLTVMAGVFMYDIPFRGSILWLLIMSSVFMLISLFLGLLISTSARNQFVASMISMLVSFLPTFILSGFLFEISSMPKIVQLLSIFIPARYFISGIQTLFLAGDVPELFIPNTLKMLLFCIVVYFITVKSTVKRLD
jgi:ABC-2 type transport system permease protein